MWDCGSHPHKHTIPVSDFDIICNSPNPPLNRYCSLGPLRIVIDLTVFTRPNISLKGEQNIHYNNLETSRGPENEQYTNNIIYLRKIGPSTIPKPKVKPNIKPISCKPTIDKYGRGTDQHRLSRPMFLLSKIKT